MKSNGRVVTPCTARKNFIPAEWIAQRDQPGTVVQVCQRCYMQLRRHYGSDKRQRHRHCHTTAGQVHQLESCERRAALIERKCHVTMRDPPQDPAFDADMRIPAADELAAHVGDRDGEAPGGVPHPAQQGARFDDQHDIDFFGIGW